MLSGGVAANSALQAALAEWSARNGVPAFVPPPKYCTDNAAMIAAAAAHQGDAVRADALTLSADPNLPFDWCHAEASRTRVAAGVLLGAVRF